MNKKLINDKEIINVSFMFLRKEKKYFRTDPLPLIPEEDRGSRSK